MLNWTEDSSAALFLKATQNLPDVKSNPTLRMSIVSDLFHWKDLSVLPLAEENLFDQSVGSPFYPKSNLVLAISSLEPQISTPLLARVLKLPQPEKNHFNQAARNRWVLLQKFVMLPNKSVGRSVVGAIFLDG